MIDASGFVTTQLQTVIYTPEHDQFSQPKLLGEVLSNFAAIFDGDVIALPPFPEELKFEAELPRVLLKSADERWELQGAPGRTSIAWNRGTSSELDNAALLNQCNEILTRLIQSLNITVGRIAFLVNRAASDNTASKDIVKHFTNDWAKGGPISRSDSFELHNLKRYQLPHLNMNVNSWMRCKTTFSINGEKSGVTPLIFVEQDLNTWAEESKIFSPDEVRDFFLAALKETQSILMQYFPKEA